MIAIYTHYKNNNYALWNDRYSFYILWIANKPHLGKFCIFSEWHLGINILIKMSLVIYLEIKAVIISATLHCSLSFIVSKYLILFFLQFSMRLGSRFWTFNLIETQLSFLTINYSYFSYYECRFSNSLCLHP